MAKTILLFFSFALLASCGGSDSITGDGGDSDGTDTTTATYIDVKASPNLVGTKLTSDISVTILDNVGDPVADVLVDFTVSVDNSGGATMGIGVAKTGSNGVATLTYTAGETGGVEDTVSVSGAGLADSVKIGVQTAVADIASLTLIADPPLPIFVAGAGEIDLNIAVIDTNNSGVADQAVSLVLVGDGSLDGASYASVTTDGQGAATQSFTVPTRLNTGGATITAQVVSSSGTKTTTLPLSFINAAATNIELSASPTSIGLQDTSSIRAIVRDQYGNPVPNENLTFTVDGTSTSTNPTFTDAGGYSAATGSATTDASGIATIDYTADATVSGTDSIIVANGAAVPVQNTIDITIDAVSTSIASVTVNALSSTITADGTSGTALQATVKDTDGQPMEGVTVDFSSSAGTLSASTADTNASGVAQVTLTSGTSLATAYITTSAGGYSAYTSVDFVSGPLATGVITAQPSSLPADGTSTSTITVALQDAYGHPVADGTTVSLLQEMSGITDATVTPSSTSTTNGRATFTVTAASEAGTDTFYLFQNDTISLTMTYGAGTTAGDPASIQVSSDRSQITVAGVGREETATVTLKVLDGTGSPIPDETYNNVRVSLVTKPNAGEFISGTTNPLSPAPVDSVATGSIEIYTKSGQTSFGIQSGTLPGIVEILIEVIDDVGGTVISAVVPQIVIASGPAHAINLTSPYTNSIENMGGGVYKRVGTAIVSDRYGNAVPDGTIVNLGIIDTVVAQDIDGTTTAAASTMTDDGSNLSDPAPALNIASVLRNDVRRYIQTNDRILLRNALAEDKSRHISSVDSGSQVTVSKPYLNTASDLNYVIGSSLVGAEIFGVDHVDTGAEVKGWGTTVDGQVTFYVKYPANGQTISMGCGIGGYACSDPTYQTDAPGVGCTANGGVWGLYRDERYIPNSSAEVYVVASTSEAITESAVTVNHGQFCFASIAGWSLTASHDKLSGDATVTLWLVDGGDVIPLPFKEITPIVVVEKSSAGVCSDPAYTSKDTCEAASETWTSVPLVDTTNLGCITDNPGQFVAGNPVTGSCTATVKIGQNAAKDDKATITWRAGDASVSVTVTLP
ncbi:MAG: Ig-like domain-containing protein [Gammaproteobacteria bacterium]|nr:Ig-like domain-containing protein [Gammaproteobacteria bacterium]